MRNLFKNAVLTAIIGLSTITANTTFADDNRTDSHEIKAFAFMGDTAYLSGTEVLFDQIIKDLNQQKLKFVIHVGDFKGEQPCSDATYLGVLEQFNASKNPLVYLPGDNEWSDCPDRSALDALAGLRKIFFPSTGNSASSRGLSLGMKTITLDRQSRSGDRPATSFDESKFVENQAGWIQGYYSSLLISPEHPMKIQMVALSE